MEEGRVAVAIASQIFGEPVFGVSSLLYWGFSTCQVPQLWSDSDPFLTGLLGGCMKYVKHLV